MLIAAIYLRRVVVCTESAVDKPRNGLVLPLTGTAYITYPCNHLLCCPSLFIQIVERLLIEKPDNPIGFIVEYLAKRYPDETRAAKVGHAGSQRSGSLASNITTASRRDKTFSFDGLAHSVAQRNPKRKPNSPPK